MLLCLAYPRLSQADEARVRSFRKKHDPQYADIVPAHWTMIFPGSSKGISQDSLSEHIGKAAATSGPINFSCRYALVYGDDGCDDYYLFLVPDEGFSGISLLHDRLYGGFMRSRLRLDVPYVPHIGIATHKDRDHLYELATQWNSEEHEINGVIDELTLCFYDGSKVIDLERFSLNNQTDSAGSPEA